MSSEMRIDRKQCNFEHLIFSQIFEVKFAVRTSECVHKVAKVFAKILQPSWDPHQGSCEVSKKV